MALYGVLAVSGDLPVMALTALMITEDQPLLPTVVYGQEHLPLHLLLQAIKNLVGADLMALVQTTQP